jgi:hypothetical protein
MSKFDPSINPKDDSIYAELEPREFSSNIPSHLLKGADEQTKYVLQQLSIIDQQNRWLIKSAVDTNQQVRHTNGRVRALENFREELEKVKTKEKAQFFEKIFNFWTVSLAILAAFVTFGSAVVIILKLAGIIKY